MSQPPQPPEPLLDVDAIEKKHRPWMPKSDPQPRCKYDHCLWPCDTRKLMLLVYADQINLRAATERAARLEAGLRVVVENYDRLLTKGAVHYERHASIQFSLAAAAARNALKARLEQP